MAGIDLKERRGTLKENYSVIAAFFPMKKKEEKRKKARYDTVKTATQTCLSSVQVI